MVNIDLLYISILINGKRLYAGGFWANCMFDAPTKGKMPYMLTLEEGEWHEMSFDMDSVTEIDNDGPRENWNAYKVDMKHDGEDLDDEIVPFHAMADFHKMAKESGSKKGWVTFEVKVRRVSEKKVKLTFRVE